MVSYLSMKSVEFAGDISVMKHAMGVMQHHDAITGTSKTFVVEDYIRMLYRGFEECFKIQNSFFRYNIINRTSLCPIMNTFLSILEKNYQRRVCHL